jgi:hypothetical protein
LPASREGTHWDEVLFVLVADRLLQSSCHQNSLANSSPRDILRMQGRPIVLGCRNVAVPLSNSILFPVILVVDIAII